MKSSLYRATGTIAQIYEKSLTNLPLPKGVTIPLFGKEEQRGDFIVYSPLH